MLWKKRIKEDIAKHKLNNVKSLKRRLTSKYKNDLWTIVNESASPKYFKNIITGQYIRTMIERYNLL